MPGVLVPAALRGAAFALGADFFAVAVFLAGACSLASSAVRALVVPDVATLARAKGLLQVFKVAQYDGGLPSQRANHIGRGVASLLDEAPGAVLGLLPCFVMGSQQLFRDLFGAPCRDPGEGGRSLAQAFQVVFCAHTESVRPPPGDVQRQARPGAKMGLVASDR